MIELDNAFVAISEIRSIQWDETEGAVWIHYIDGTFNSFRCSEENWQDAKEVLREVLFDNP